MKYRAKKKKVVWLHAVLISTLDVGERSNESNTLWIREIVCPTDGLDIAEQYELATGAKLNHGNRKHCR